MYIKLYSRWQTALRKNIFRAFPAGETLKGARRRTLTEFFRRAVCHRLYKIAIKSYIFVRALLPGDYCGGGTPVPFPNTEVKPSCADDTASLRGGKVGHRRAFLFFTWEFCLRQSSRVKSASFLLFYIFFIHRTAP